MVSPLCGLDRTLGFVLRGRSDLRFLVAGADMTGVHVLRGRPEPGSYHIGGTGLRLDEAVIRALGETVERYAQLVSALDRRRELVFATADELARSGRPLLDLAKIRYFSPEQHAAEGFPFQPLDPAAPLGWVRTASLPAGGELWVPAQLVLVGYEVRREQGEPWLYSAMTTGTAAHTDRAAALGSALLEVIQIDAAMGHWYSDASARRIRLDDRTAALERLIRRTLPPLRGLPEFYWLESADLGTMTVACAIKAPGRVPAVAVGLGIDLRLGPALYKALLEAVGVVQLAKVAHVNRALAEDGEIDPERILDLDSNVFYYALPERASRLDDKFPPEAWVDASALPPDSTLDARAEAELLVERFRSTGKQLVGLDLAGEDVRELGFVVPRVWSPDTLSLSLPSAPPVEHPRFAAYGGVAHRDPHPYP